MNYRTKIECLLEAFNRRDFDTLSRFIHHNAKVQLPNGVIVKGLNNVLVKWQEFIEVFPNIQYIPIQISYKEPFWQTTVNVSGTFTNELQLPSGNILAPTGNRLDMRQLIDFQFDGDGKMIFERKEYNMAEFMEQLLGADYARS